MSKKSSIITLCSSGLVASTSQAAIIFNNFTDVTLADTSTDRTYYDFETATISADQTADSDFMIRASQLSANTYLITNLKSDYFVLGGEFDTGSAYAGGEAGATGTNQRLAIAFEHGDTIHASGELYNSSLILTQEDGSAGSDYDFSTPNSAIGLAHFDNAGSFKFGFLNVEKGSLILQSGGSQDTFGLTGITVTPVPEPSSLALLSLGVLGIASYRKRSA
ncbi:MAG: PEP-CTERM sorting domain-containing protein [Akkermansiaceae bacterium]